MANETPPPKTIPKLWVMYRGYTIQRAMVESDHLMLLTANGYHDDIRRILFSRIARMYVSRARRISGRVVSAMSLLLIDVGILTIIAVHLSTPLGMIVVLALVGWPLPLLFGWMLFALTNPAHHLYIVRDGKTHHIKTTLSNRDWGTFYSDLCHSIEAYQQKYTLASASVREGIDADSVPNGPVSQTAPPSARAGQLAAEHDPGASADGDSSNGR